MARLRSAGPAGVLAALILASLIIAATASIAVFACMRISPARSDPPFGLECRLRMEEPLRAGGPVILRFTLSRISGSGGSGDKPVYALRWYTPLEGIRGSFLKVEREGVAIPYQGPMVKRGDPSLEDYVEVFPDKPVEGMVDLGPAYDFSRPGGYTVEFKAGLGDLVDEPTLLPRPRDAHRPVPLACDPVRFELRP